MIGPTTDPIAMLVPRWLEASAGGGFGYLSRNPLRRRMFGYADPNQSSTLQSDNDQGIQYVEPDRRELRLKLGDDGVRQAA